MPTIRVIRTWEVTIPQKDLDALKEKGISNSGLLWTCSEYANIGEFGTLYHVRYKPEGDLYEFTEGGAFSDTWGTFNDACLGEEGKDYEILYTLENWDAKEQEWNVG